MFVLHMMDREGHQQVRADNRAAHLAYLDEHKEHVKVGGPILSDDRNDMIGSLLIVSFDTREEVEKFLADEPYAQAGLFETVAVHPWKRAIFRE